MSIFRLKYLPFWIIGIIAVIACSFTEWMVDGIVYQYVVQWGGDALTPDDRIKNVGDIIVSQNNHYWYSNGRYFLHFFVQLFCGLLGKYVFAICNGIVWGLLPAACLKVVGIRISLRSAAFTTSLLVLMMFYLRLDPAFQMNYVWMSLIICGFLLLFFSHKSYNILQLVLIAIYSFLAGEGNEGFSFATGVAVIVYAAIRQFRLRPQQWTGAISFGAGTIVQLVAPANWSRLGKMTSESSLLNGLEAMIPALIIPFIYIILCILMLNQVNSKQKGNDRTVGIMLWSAVIAGYLLCFALKGGAGARTAIPANLYLIFIIVRRFKDVIIPVAACVSTCLIALVLIGFEIKSDIERSLFVRNIYSRYKTSESGLLYVSDVEFARNADHIRRSKDFYALAAATQTPGKPMLRIRPESMRNISEDIDTNMTVRIADNVWILYRSKRNPKDLVVHKIILPSLLNKKMGDRLLDFADDKDVIFDSTRNSLIGIYFNKRPYIKADVEVE